MHISRAAISYLSCLCLWLVVSHASKRKRGASSTDSPTSLLKRQRRPVAHPTHPLLNTKDISADPKKIKPLLHTLLPLPTVLNDMVAGYLGRRRLYVMPYLVRQFDRMLCCAFLRDGLVLVGLNAAQERVIVSRSLLVGNNGAQAAKGGEETPLTIVSREEGLLAFGVYLGMYYAFVDGAGISLWRIQDGKEVLRVSEAFPSARSIRLASDVSRNKILCISDEQKLVLIDLGNLTSRTTRFGDDAVGALHQACLNEAGTFLACIFAKAGACLFSLRSEAGDDEQADQKGRCTTNGLPASSLMFLKDSVLAVESKGKHTFYRVDEGAEVGTKLSDEFVRPGLRGFSYNPDAQVVVAIDEKGGRKGKGGPFSRVEAFFQGIEIWILDFTGPEWDDFSYFGLSPDLRFMLTRGRLTDRCCVYRLSRD